MADLDWRWLQHKTTGKLFLKVACIEDEGQFAYIHMDEGQWISLYLFLMRGFYNNCGWREWAWAGVGALVLMFDRAVHPKSWNRNDKG